MNLLINGFTRYVKTENLQPDLKMSADLTKGPLGILAVLLFLTFCLLLLLLWESVILLCFVVRYFMSIVVLQSS